MAGAMLTMLVATPALAQLSGKGLVDHMVTIDLPTCNSTTTPETTGMRAWNTSTGLAVMCDGTNWVTLTTGSLTELNDLETIATNAADGEVFIGTGADAGAYITGLAACAANQKIEYTAGAPDTLACEAIVVGTGDVTDGSLAQVDMNDTDSIGGNPAMVAWSAWLSTEAGTGGVIFEGTGADDNEGLLASSGLTADHTWTLPDLTGTLLVPGSSPAITGEWDFGGGGIEIENSDTLPGACTVGQVFLDTNETSGQQLFACEGGSFVPQGNIGTLPTGQAIVQESCTDPMVEPCYTTIQAAVTAVETAASDGSRVVFVFPPEGDYNDIVDATPLGAYEEDVICCGGGGCDGTGSPDGHTTIKGMSGGYGLRGAPVLKGDVGAGPTLTLDHCSIENFHITGRGQAGDRQIVTGTDDVDHVGVRNVVVHSNTGFDAGDHVIEILHNDGVVEFDDVRLTGFCDSPDATSALVYFDMTGAAVSPEFRWDGGRIAMTNPGGVGATRCVTGTAAIELRDTFPGALFSNFSLACEGTESTCIEVNDDLVEDVTFANVTIEQPVDDTVHGKLLDIVDVDADGGGTVASTIYLEGFDGLTTDWFSADSTEAEALIAGEDLFGTLHWSGPAAGDIATNTSGADNCYPGWTFTDLQPGAGLGSVWHCEGTSGGEGTWTGPYTVRSYTWNAENINADGTECSDHAEVAAIGGAGGPQTYGIACPMGTAETDGFLYGNTVMPDGWDGSTVTFELTAYMATDGGAGTFHGQVDAQCRADTETISNTWGTQVGLDMDEEAGDVQWDVISVTSAAVTPAGTCAAGDTLWWRWLACDVDATPTAGCTSSTAATIADLVFTNMKMEYTTRSRDG